MRNIADDDFFFGLVMVGTLLHQVIKPMPGTNTTLTDEAGVSMETGHDNLEGR